MTGVASITRDVHELTDPRAIPGLELWLDARYPNGIGSAMPFDGDLLANWTDLSGKGRHVSQPTAAKRPVWRKQGQTLVMYWGHPQWNLNSSHIIEESGEVLNVGNSGESNLTVPVPRNARRFRVNAKANATGFNNEGLEATRVFSSIYYAEDMTTKVKNSAGYSANGNASDIAIDGSWTDVQWIYWINNPEIAFMNIGIASYKFTPDVRYRDFWISFEVPDGASFVWTQDTYIPPVDLPAGQPVVEFDGVDDSMVSQAFNGLDGDITVYTVVQHKDLSAIYPRVVRKQNGTGGWGVAPSTKSNISRMFFFNQNSGPTISTSGAGSTGVWYVTAGTLSGMTTGTKYASSYLNGVFGSTSSSTDTYISPAGGKISVGSDVGGPPFLTGSIAAIVAFNGAHDSETRNKVERMLARNYGVVLS